MDITQVVNYGLPAIILFAAAWGLFRAGRFVGSEITEWRKWLTQEYMPTHLKAEEMQSEMLTEIKLLLQQMVLNLNSVREELENRK